MADNIVDSLFGPTAIQIGQARDAALAQAADRYAAQDPFARASGQLYRAGGMFAGPVANALGMVDPMVEQARRREAIMGQGGDLSTAAGLKEKAAQFAASGDQQTAMKLLMAARAQEVQESKMALEAATTQAQQYKATLEAAQAAKALREPTGTKEMQNAEAIVEASGIKRGSPEWAPAVAKKLDELVKNPNLESAPPSVREYEYAVSKDGYKGTYADWLKTKSQAIHINMNGAGALTPASADTAIDLALVGDPTLMAGWGRSPKDKATMLNRLTERMKSGEISPRQFAEAKIAMAGALAGERVVSSQGANIQLSANEANQMIDVVRGLYPQVNLTDYPSLNVLKNAVDKQLGGPAVPKLYAGLNALVNTYARAINPRGVATVRDKEKAETMINQAMSTGQLEGVMQVMKQEMDAALASPGAVRSSLAAQRGAPVPTPGLAASGGAAVGKPTVSNW